MKTSQEPPLHTILLLQKNYKTSSKNTKLCWFTPTKEKSVTKDKSEQLEKSGIYEIKCDGFNAVYIGQTKRSVSVRFGEHFRHIRYNHPNLSNVACNVLEHI
jgi:hypothetical protein